MNHLDPPYGTGEEGDFYFGNITRIFSEDFNEFRYPVAMRYDGSVVGDDVYIRK